jgi:transcription initiation factor TFIID subunit 1
LKDIAFEGFNGVEELGQKFSPEQVAANWSARAAEQHLRDLGIYELPAMNNIVTNTASAMIYLNGCISAAKKRKQKMSKMLKAQSKSTKSKQAFYNKADMALDSAYKEIKKKGEIAAFIHEELLLAPWNITADFIDVHRKGQGTGMMKLTGLGDPSGQGNAYNFIREVDTKPNKGTGNSDGALKATVKKITGTDNDLRKLSMTQMASILRSYGMDDTEIKNLKRWDRVHVIRDLSTKAASDNAGDGLERFARGEKMKLSDQKRMYRERIQEIWERQRKALADTKGLQDSSRGGGLMSKFSEGSGDEEKAPDVQNEDEKEESSDDEEDDFFEEFENTFKDAEQTNALVKDQLIGDSSEGDMKRGAIYNTAGTELNKEARELASLVRQRQEERDNQFGIDAASKLSGSQNSRLQQSTKGRKVVRRKVTKTYPDGRQTVTFKFIVAPHDVETAISKKEAKEKTEELKRKKKERKNNKYLNEKSRYSQKAGFQHSLFEGDDEYQTQIKRKPRGGRSRKSDTDYSPPRRKQMGGMGKIEGAKSKQKVSREKQKIKRKREKEEAELYISNARRKGTNNRRERGSAREKPHVIYADKLEQIRQNCEKRPGSGPFHRPVDRSIYPHYYEMISNPIDLQTIRDKIQKYEYKRSDLFIHDFETMRDNAIKFNGVGSAFAKEATSMYDFVKTFIDQNREEFTAMEEAVDDQLNAGKKRNSRASTPNNGMSKAPKGKTATVTFDGIATEVNLGNLDGSFFGGGSDSD